jgi:hypothetical protein
MFAHTLIAFAPSDENGRLLCSADLLLAAQGRAQEQRVLAATTSLACFVEMNVKVRCI